MQLMFRQLLTAFVVALVATPTATSAQTNLKKFGRAELDCLTRKQIATADYCDTVFEAWSYAESTGDIGTEPPAIADAAGTLATVWRRTERRAARNDVDCVGQTVTAQQQTHLVTSTSQDVVAAVNASLDLGNADDRSCGADLLVAFGEACADLLLAEGRQTRRSRRNASRRKKLVRQGNAFAEFAARAAAITARPCSVPTVDALGEHLGDMVNGAVFNTAVSPELDDSEFVVITPDPAVEYRGRQLEARCAKDDAPDFHFFAKRGSTNKLLVYYQGGGACWENTSCNFPTCKLTKSVEDENPGRSGGFGFFKADNPDNPFADWNIVYIPYCTCDVHFGDAVQTYTGSEPDVTIYHRGFQNSKVVEKIAREYFANPAEVVVAGSSAGGYGALFNGPHVRQAWPSAHLSVLGDASSGVITPEFLENEFGNWAFRDNIPDNVPEAAAAIDDGSGIVGYITAAARAIPHANWAQYTTAYDGSAFGQTGIYRIMLNDNNPLAALNWWESTCDFNAEMISAVADTYATTSAEKDNYRYFIGAGTQHTIFQQDKVYAGQEGGEPMTFAEWMTTMIGHDTQKRATDVWQNAECTDCGFIRDGDPVPDPVDTPPFTIDETDQVRIDCAP